MSGQESTEACPFQKRGEASGEKLELKVKDEQSVISSMLQQHHVSNENPVKGTFFYLLLFRSFSSSVFAYDVV